MASYSLCRFFSALISTNSSATSTGTRSHASKNPSACNVIGKFVGTKVSHEKVFWLFDSIETKTTKNCERLRRTFEILIPSGSFSRLNHSIVYPISITEPSVGAEIDLRLEYIQFKTGAPAWIITGDPDAYRVIRR
jgi:hypothetical protein